MQAIDRRDFLKYSAALTVGAGVLNTPLKGAEEKPERRFLKAVQLQMLPGALSDVEKFKLAKQCGFEGVEAAPPETLEAARKQADAARQAGVDIHSLVFGWWPTSLGDARTAQKSLADMEHALRCANAMGADAVLLVPTRVTEEYAYTEAYKDSQSLIRKLIPLADELKVVVAVENVWNKFLLSPLEFARYLDEFESHWVRAYFDVGNVIIHGFAQDWIRTLGSRIVKVHLKDFKRDGYQWKHLGEGDVNWPQVGKALAEVGYTGYLTPELQGGDEAYLTDLSGRIDRLVS